MSVLAPLYFLGALAIGLPILFHMIRRQPRGQVPFSSLMFLQPTPPRLTRRSRLDNWLLLLMRALALILLALAFARPFLRSTAMSDLQSPARRLVLVIDSSASMQRTGLWQQAIDQANDVIDELAAGDQLAIITFDDRPKTLLSFDQSARLAPEQLQAAARSSLADAKPTWRSTNLGRAISFAADLAVTYEADDNVNLEDGSDSKTSTVTGPANMIVISDMQRGARIESLQAYAWPDQLQLEVRQIKPQSPTNAFAKVLTGRDESVDEQSDQKDRIRVRVENSADADRSQFRLAWSTNTGNEVSPLPVQVPPGESRVMRMPLPQPDVTSLVLHDDDHEFDNRSYLVSPQPRVQSLIYLGQLPAEDIAAQRESLLHYLSLVPLSNPRREVTVQAITPSDFGEVPTADDTPLVVVGEVIESDVAERLKQYLEQGGQVLFVLATPQHAAIADGLKQITGAEELQIGEAEIEDYVMLSGIDFKHPLFATMADPKYNDFTKIHFWSHRTLSGIPDDWTVVANFDDAQPALVEQRIGQGTIRILAAGWQPTASQLALSTKFIPLVFNFFAAGTGKEAGRDYVVGGAFDLKPSPTAKIAGPGNEQFRFASSDDIAAIDRPGIYHYNDGDQTRAFAVNLDVAESRTDALPEDALERFGISLGKTLSVAELQANQRQLRDVELEGRQKLWQWLIAAALLLLALETWLGGRLSRRQMSTSEST
jgi:hypothetical protein